MDSQRSLFKKFFGSNNKVSSETSSNSSGNSSGGFNPPKFQFDKKKLGNARISSSNDNAIVDSEICVDEDKVMKEIESAGIDDSELGDHLDDWKDNSMSTGTEMGAETEMQMDTTMNTTKIVTNEHNNPAVSEPRHPINTATAPVNHLASQLHKNIQQKNQQKYNLSNQLDLFDETIEMALRKCGEKRNKIELLVLGIDEKIGKTAP